MVDKIDVSTAEKGLNAKYNFFSLLEQLEVPAEGGTKEQDRQLRLLVDRWGKGNDDITSSLRNTFDEGGTGEERLAHEHYALRHVRHPRRSRGRNSPSPTVPYLQSYSPIKKHRH